MLTPKLIDGHVEVYNNLGDHWVWVIPKNKWRNIDFTERLHRIATWKIHLKKIPENNKYRFKDLLIFYDSANYSLCTHDISWRFPEVKFAANGLISSLK